MRAPEFTLEASDSKVTIISGEDLVTGNWKAANINVQSTGLFDSAGSFIGGSITVPTRFQTADGVDPTNITVTALNDINFEAELTAERRVSLHAGRALNNLPTLIAATGADGTIDLSSGEDLIVPGTLRANGRIQLESTDNRGTGGNVVVLGDVLAGDEQIRVKTSRNSSRIDGVISGNGGLNLSGGGTLTLNAANTYSVTTLVDGSRLIVNGSTATGSSIIVSSGSTLGGNGVVGGLVSIETGGLLSPGNSPGRLATGSLNFASGSTFLAEVTGLLPATEYDQVVVNGTVELNSAILELPNAVPQFALRKDDTFALIVNDGTDAVSGRFTYEGTLLEEGMIIPDFLGSGKGALITYVGNIDGGSIGNDVLLIIINTPPVAVDDETSTSEDESVTLNVLTNDTDLEDNISPNLTINL